MQLLLVFLAFLVVVEVRAEEGPEPKRSPNTALLSRYGRAVLSRYGKRSVDPRVFFNSDEATLNGGKRGGDLVGTFVKVLDLLY